MTDLSPEIAALVDYAPIEAARAATDAEQRAFEAAVAEAAEADAALAEAKAALPALLQKAVEGGAGAVSDKAIVAADRRIYEAERVAEFGRVVASRLEPSRIVAEARLSAARAKAYAPVLERGIDLAIEAARLGDQAAGNVARKAFAAASAIINIALTNGARHPGATHRGAWPTTEAHQRQIWGRPALVQERAA